MRKKYMRMIFAAVVMIIMTDSVLAQVNAESIIELEKKNFQRNELLKRIEYPGDPSIDITYYKLELNITSVRYYITGAAAIGIKGTRGGLESFFLDLQSGLKVDSVVMNNRKLSFTHSGNELKIALPAALDQGEIFYVKVFYKGNAGPNLFRNYVDTTHSGQRVIWTWSQPFGARMWFPCKDAPGDKADSSDVWVTCPSAMTVASNGTLQEDKDNGDGTRLVKWKNSYPIAHYLISIAASNYTIYTNYFCYSQTDSMPVVNYVFPEDFTLRTKSEIDKTPQMLKIFSEKFGLYPFINEKYGHAQLVGGGAMEHQTMTTIRSFFEEVISHELAHQWFGDKITCADWNNMWLNEGFATYLTGIYYEAVYGKPRYNTYMNAQIMNKAKDFKGSVYVKNISDDGSEIFTDGTYNKGAYVLHMLRGVVGDSAFFKILRAYANDPRLSYGVAVTADFQAVAEQVYGQSLKYFFDEWIFGENYPQYSLTWNARNIQSNAYQIILNIAQKQNSSPLFFTMPVQLKIHTDIMDTIITVFNNAQNQSFSLNVIGKPEAVSLDPDNWILKDVLASAIDDYNSSVNYYKLEQNYPNPFNPGTKIKFHIAAGNVSSGELTNVTLKVFDILGREVLTLVNEPKPAGSYEIDFNASQHSLDSGVYYYKLQAGDYTESRKMVYIK